MARFHNRHGARVQFTPEEEIARDAEEKVWRDGAFDRAIVGLREKRNALLAETDWTQIPDSAFTNEKSAEWKLYRQKLRNLPAGLDTVDKVNAVTWPEKPE
jgi:hypothetical protein